MNKIALVLVIVGMAIGMAAQTTETSRNTRSTYVYKSVEQMPTFPGGDAALMKYISTHIQFPKEAADWNFCFKVIVQFVVTQTGEIGEVKVVRSQSKELDAEAVRLCKSLPKFIPGRQDGQPVDVWYTLPITFRPQGMSQY